MINKETGQRELAYVEKIDWIKPIDGADNIELAGVLGWTLIIKKGEFKVGDKCVYFEIDSKLPEKEWSEFLASKHYKVKTYQLKKFNVISQGLALPLDLVGLNPDDYSIGDFLTETLGVKYSVEEDNTRKRNITPEERFRRIKSKHQKVFSNPIIKKIMKYKLGRFIMFNLFKHDKVTPTAFPTKFDFIHKTDEERCLIGDTKILTDNGHLRIADIVNKKIDCKVLSYNPDTNQLEYNKILDYQKYPAEKEMIKFTFPMTFNGIRKNTLVCTLDHRLLTNKGYKKAEDISLNDFIYLYDKTYSDEIIPYLYGNILGDGHLIFDKRNSTNNCGFSFCQGESHKEYVEILRKIYNGGKIIVENSGYKPENKIYKFHLTNTHILSAFLTQDNCIHNNEFKITPEFCNRLTEQSIALWYMDDGSCSFDKSKLKKGACLSSCAFSEEENILLADTLKTKFNLDCKVLKDSKGYFYISFTRDSSIQLFKLIAKYFPKCMQYKLPENLKTDYSYLDGVEFKPYEKILPVHIISIEKTNHFKFSKFSNSAYVYDLEIENVHNFIASNIVNHNCENMPSIVLNYPNPLIATEKLDGTSSTYILERKSFNRFEFYVCSRNVRMLTPKQKCYVDHNIYYDNALKYDIENKLKQYLIEHPELKYVCIQGESVGNVQGNPLKLNEDDLYIFNFIRSDIGRIPSTDGKEIIESWGMKWVPILDTAFVIPEGLTMADFKQYANGNSVVNPKVLREGIVYRDPTNDFSFKNVDPIYLMKHNE